MANFLNESIEGFNELAKATEKWKKELLDSIKITKKAAQEVSPAKARAENINTLAQAEKNLIKTEKDLIEVSKEEAKIAKKINDLKTEEGKKRIEGNLILQDERKKAKLAAKERLGLTNAYQQESKKLNDLRNKYKNLAVQNKENTKVGQKYLAQITKLDAKLKGIDKAVGQNFRSVGNYKEAVGTLTPVLGTFGSKLNQIQSTLTAAKQGFLQMAGAQEKSAKSSKVLSFAMKAIPIFAIVGAITALIAAFAGTQRGMNALRKVTEPLKAIFDALLGVVQDVSFWFADKLGEAFENPVQAMKDLGQALIDNVINRFKALGLFMDAIVLFMNGEYKAAFKKGADAAIQLGTGVTDATDKMSDLVEKGKEVISTAKAIGDQIADLKQRFEELEIKSIVPIAKLKLEFQQLKEIANDQLKTDEERVAALVKAEQVQKRISKNERELLQLKLDALILSTKTSDTDNETLKEIEILKREQLNFEAQAQKKISGIVSLRTGMELRMLKERFKAAQDFDDIFNEREEKAVKQQRELVGKIAEVNNEAIDEADRAYAESLERRRQEEIAFARSVTEETGAELEKRIQQREESLKQEQTDIEKSISVQQGLAEKGLENSLAFEKEQLAKNQLEQLENEKKAARLKEAQRLGELFLTLKEAEAQEQVEGSTARALQGVAEAKALTASIKLAADIAGFEKGGLVEGGEQIVRINEKGEEFVIDAPTTAALGLNKRGADMGDFKSMLSMHDMKKEVVKNSSKNENELSTKLDSVVKAIEKQPFQQIDIDNLGNVIETISSKNIKKITRLKTRSRL